MQGTSKKRRDTMGNYSEDENSYDSIQGSDLDETDQAWSSEEDGCDGSCSDDDYCWFFPPLAQNPKL